MIPYGKWHPIVLRCVFPRRTYLALTVLKLSESVNAVTHGFSDGGGRLFDVLHKLCPFVVQSVRLVGALPTAVSDQLDVSLKLVPELRRRSVY